MEGASKKNILVVDDEADVAELVAYHLRAQGYTVELTQEPHRVIAHARTFQPNLVVLDVMMPGLSGIQICRLFRADPQLKRIPLIFLTAKAEASDRIIGLEAGADDYLCKPFSMQELLLRVQGLLRRSSEPEAAEHKQLKAGRVLLDVDHHEVWVEERLIDLTATEFRLLRLLMERRGRVQSRDSLLLNVWNYETEIETRTVDTHIRRLREKLGREADLIETIRGVGYRIAEKRPEACSS